LVYAFSIVRWLSSRQEFRSTGTNLAQSSPPDNGRHAIIADRIFDGQHWHVDAAVLMEGGRVMAVGSPGALPANATQQRLPPDVFLAPGFVDLQVNGGGGVLLNDNPDAEAMKAIARTHRRLGTTACLPTLITDTREKTRATIAAARQIAGQEGVLGLHLEGPFLNPARAGVHRRNVIARAEMRDLDWLGELAEVGRSAITLAPECVPVGFIRELASRGIRVCAGHSEATADEIVRAIGEGLTGVTHLFNAMPAISARVPGLAGTALAEPKLIASLIVDGIHVDFVTVRAAFAAKSANGIALVTDAMPTVGTTSDHFRLMDRIVALRNGRLTDENGTLAGAHLDLATAVRNAVMLARIPIEDALRSVSYTPARFLGLEKECGALIPGARADLVALSDDLRVVGCWFGGAQSAH